MKKSLLVPVFFTFAIIIPMPEITGVDIYAGISLPPPTVFEAPREVRVMPASGVYLVAEADANIQQGSAIGRDEKQQDQSLEKGGKPSGSEHKSNWRINVWPQQAPDNVKSPHEMKDENKHTPPDRPD